MNAMNKVELVNAMGMRLGFVSTIRTILNFTNNTSA